MLITKNFIMLNFPKTGSSFAREIIKKVYRQRMKWYKRFLSDLKIIRSEYFEIFCPIIDEARRKGIKTQHGTFRQIPERYRNRPIISITRNPFSRYISLYHFKWWAKHPPAEIDEIKSLFPNFPDLSFEEFYKMIHIFDYKNRLKGISPKMNLGIQTIQFIQFYFNEPEKILSIIDQSYIDSFEFKKDIAPIKFLHQENLNFELIELLKTFGFSEEELKFIEQSEKINVSPKPSDTSVNYYNTKIKQEVLERDYLIFKIFPEYLTEAIN